MATHSPPHLGPGSPPPAPPPPAWAEALSSSDGSDVESSGARAAWVGAPVQFVRSRKQVGGAGLEPVGNAGLSLWGGQA